MAKEKKIVMGEGLFGNRDHAELHEFFDKNQQLVLASYVTYGESKSLTAEIDYVEGTILYVVKYRTALGEQLYRDTNWTNLQDALKAYNIINTREEYKHDLEN